MQHPTTGSMSHLRWLLSSQYLHELLFITEQSSFFGHHELLRSPVENAIDRERSWIPLAETRLTNLSPLRHSVPPEEQVLKVLSGIAAPAQAMEIERGRNRHVDVTRTIATHVSQSTQQLQIAASLIATNRTTKYYNYYAMKRLSVPGPEAHL